MPARAAPLPSIGRRLRDWIVQAKSRRLGPDGEIDAWTLSFADPHVDSGFLQSNLEQLRSSFRRIVVVMFCGLAFVLYLYVYGEDTSEYPTQDAYIMRQWQLALQVACFGVELSTLIAAIVLSDYGLIGPRVMEVGAIVVLVVAELHAGVNMRHYVARAFGCEDPSAAWGVDLTGSDAPFLLYLILCVTGAGTAVRWKSLVPLAVLSVLEYVAAAYLLGGPDTRLAPTNLMFFTIIVLLTCTGKRSSEFQARLLHLSYLREKQMRFRAEFSLECLKDREDVDVEIGSFAAGSSYFKQFTDDVHQGSTAGSTACTVRASSGLDGGGVPLARRPQGSPCAPPNGPAWLGPAAAGCAQEASDVTALERSGCVPLDASVWVEGRADSCSLRDLEQGQRVLCYDSLGRSIRYAEVLEKQVGFRELPWVSVGLDDGTQLAMTADHPVQRADQRGVVRAADLSPGKDSVVVHRVTAVPVAVREVSRQPGARGEGGRPHLAVRHPDRHLVLVSGAGPGPQADARSTAAWSAETGAVAMWPHVVRTGGTFPRVHSALECVSPWEARSLLRRSLSEPPRTGRLAAFTGV